ncbi:protein yellow-like [Cloeon dipterum]|uniref:protein yellow-like n=1 Tax=Cloeon dipterum TaxID=197152 RepID=UPI0032208EEA
MAVFGTRIFLSLEKFDDIPVTLVSLRTSSASSSSPKLTPFPSWAMNKWKDCNKIQAAKGLDVDSVGRLWVLDNGSDSCSSKLWTIDLANNDQTKLIIQFPFQKLKHDLVLDETPNGTFAYISLWGEQHIVVFNLERNQSWTLDTPGIKVFSIALSPIKDQEPRKLYLGVSTTPTNCTSCIKGGNFPGKRQADESTNYALIGSVALFLVLSCIISLWITLRIRKTRNSNEKRNAGAEEMEIPTLPSPVSPELVDEEIENDLYGVVTAPPPRS